MQRRIQLVLVIAIVFVIPDIVRAQIPAGTLIHLVADTGIVVTNDGITAWYDTDDTAKVFTALKPQNEPTLTTTYLNKHRTVRFDGVANFLQGPPIFPIAHDYTICVVARTTNFLLYNNLISGQTHALFLDAGIFPHVVHGNFNAMTQANTEVTANPSIIIARYRQANQYAGFRVNGLSADSGYVGTNTDSTLYIGAFAQIAFYGGDIAEVYLYPRYLSDSDAVQLEDSLFARYDIPAPLIPDSTFGHVPQALQLYPRDRQDSATMPIDGKFVGLGFDSIYVRITKQGTPYYYAAHLLDSMHQFAFTPRLHAELAEYHVWVGVKNSTRDSILRSSDSVVCGDVLLIDGQSNCVFGADLLTSGEYCRTVGSEGLQTPADTLWSLSKATGGLAVTTVGVWGLRLQLHYQNDLRLPTAMLDGAVRGTLIEQHLPSALNPSDTRTIYGSLLYRAQKAHIAEAASAIFWYQGEGNTIASYFDNFEALHNSWRRDYPNVQKIYDIQVRPGCNSGTPSQVRELQRNLSRYYPDVVTHTTMGLPGHDGCHFLLDSLIGYRMLGDQLFKLVDRDLFHSTDTIGIRSPNPVNVFYADSTHQQVRIVFATGGSRMLVPNDTIINTIPVTFRNHFYLDRDTGNVKSIRAAGDTVILDLVMPTVAHALTYLPDQFYNGVNSTYEGPWLTNAQGLGAFSFWNVPITEYQPEAVETVAQLRDAFSVYPNPASGDVTISYSLARPGSLTIEVLNVLGTRVSRVSERQEQPGVRSISLDCDPFRSGTYFIRMKTSSQTITRRLVIER